MPLAGLDPDLPIYVSYIAGMAGACRRAQLLLVEMGSHYLFPPGWPQTSVLLMSAS
jgi:hypothetical protein